MAEAALGAAVVAEVPLGGGDLSQVRLLTLADGREVVLKRAPGAEREAAMLRAISAAGCPAPEVLAEGPGWLAMTRLAAGGRPDADAWQAAGAAVARLHRAFGDRYGWARDHAFGAVAIENGEMDDWPAFWAGRRLLPTARGAPGDIARRVGALAARLPEVLPLHPPAALLHGDLWAGNLLFGPSGFSGLIDPACYHGHGEADLAMLTLFGAPPPAFFAGYGPLEAGWQARRPVYQLWPALVHLRLFGAGYRGLVERCLARAEA